MRNRAQRTITIGLSLIAAFAAGTSMVGAHTGATGIVKERMDLMKGMAGSMKAMGAMFKGETAFDPDVIAEKARFLAEHATMIPEMTPEGSDDHPSEVLPIVWLQWDGYIAEAEAMADASAALLETVNGGADQSTLREHYVKLGKTCGTCHDRFRKPEE